MRAAPVLCCVVIALAGCGMLRPLRNDEPTRLGYHGAMLPTACEPDYQGRAREVAATVCGAALPDPIDSIDPRAPDPLDAAEVVIACVASRACTGTDHPTRLADVVHYARGLDLKALGRRLASLPLDGDLRRLYYRRAEACRTAVLDQAAAMPPGWHDALVAPLDRTRERLLSRDAATATQAAALTELAPRIDRALVARTAEPALARELAELHRSYVRACTGLGNDLRACVAGYGPARRLATVRAQLAATAGDAPLAAALAWVVHGTPALTSDRAALRATLDAALAALHGREREYAAASRRGVSADAIATARGGAAFVDDDTRNELSAGGAAADPPLEVRGATALEAQVDRVTRKGDLAELGFRAEISVSQEGIGCHDTNRVTRITDTGAVEYEVRCASYRDVRTNLAPPPITVPAAEARGVGRGAVVLVFHDDRRRGHLAGRRPAPREPFAHGRSPSPIGLFTELVGLDAEVDDRPPPLVRAVTAAVTAERAGDYATAAARYQSASAHSASPALVLATARASEAAGQLEQAAAHYTRYRSLAGVDATAADLALAGLALRSPVAGPPPPAMKPFGIAAYVGLGGGASDRSGGVAAFGATLGGSLYQRLDVGLLVEKSGGDVDALFGLAARVSPLTGRFRPYALGALAVGRYDGASSRPVRTRVLGAGLALLETGGRRVGLGVTAELSRRWSSIGVDPLLSTQRAESDVATVLTLGLVVRRQWTAPQRGFSRFE